MNRLTRFLNHLLPASKHDLLITERNIMAKVSSLNAVLTDILSKLDEAQTELTAEIQKLKDQLSDVDIPADAEATLNSVLAKSTAMANIISSPEEPPVEPPTP